MAKRILSIVSSAYRATIEEQDDTIVWLNHAMRGAGAELGLVLAGNAVNYAVKRQRANGLQFGDWTQTNPPDLAGDLEKLRDKGVPLYIVDEDLAERGITFNELISGLKPTGRKELPRLMGEYDLVWQW